MSFKIRAGYYRELTEHPLTMLRYNQDNYQNKLSNGKRSTTLKRR